MYSTACTSQIMAVNTVEEDSAALKTLVLCAKKGNWEKVWEILGTPDNPKKSFFINCIPESRRWGILHQAVFWNDRDNLRTLLQFRTCDASIKTKSSTCETGYCGGKTPLEIALSFKYEDMEIILNSNKRCLHDQEMDTFQLYRPSNENEYLGLFRLTLASYKKVFHPKKADPTISLSSLIEKVFFDMNTSQRRWKAIRDTVIDSMRFVNDTCDAAIEGLQKCKKRKEFYQSIINTYTTEKTYIYAILNTAMRRQREKDYRPTASDLSLGPFALVYQMLLMHWDKLERESGRTYRKIKLHAKALQKYEEGAKFTWLSFASSTVEREKAKRFPTRGTSAKVGNRKVIFIIDNSANSSWRPRNIETLAAYKEMERVYPAGATFTVTRVEKAVGRGETTIYLSLHNPADVEDRPPTSGDSWMSSIREESDDFDDIFRL